MAEPSPRGLTPPSTTAAAPLLSVVVPVFNVADLLAASLHSVLNQPLHDIEVIVVDDGSTDRCPEILAEIAAADPRVQVIRQSNSGVSVARNNALALCRGRFLTFVDPDDELPPDAWSRMLDTLARTGSDFVVGKAERVWGQHWFVTPLMERNHTTERLGIGIADAPLMLADVFVWNKIFRRDFFESVPIRFPERTRYQDQPAMTEAFLTADAFDVITDVVYHWRVRDSEDSATQTRAEVANLAERLATKHATVAMVAEYCREHGDTDLMRVLVTEILPIDMRVHLRAAAMKVRTRDPDADVYWQMLRAGMAQLWNPETVPFDQVSLPPLVRLMGWLVETDQPAGLVRLMRLVRAGRINRPERPEHKVQQAGIPEPHPWANHPDLPPALRSLT